MVAVALRRASAAARHVVWAMALAATLAVPVLAGVLPRWSVPVRTRLAAAASERTAAGPDRPAGTAGRTGAGPTEEDRAGPADLPDGGGMAHPGGPPRVTAVPVGQRPATVGRNDVSVWACAAWLSGVAGVGGCWAAGVVVVWRIGRRATAVTRGPLFDRMEDVRRRLGVGRAVRLLVGEPGSMPATWGVLRPTLVLPAEAVGWPADRARAVLLHEMAHVRRRDCAVQHLVWLATAVYWFNPLVWLAGRQLRLERERACDDVVVTRGTAPTAYAEQLVALARTFAGRGWAATAAVDMARRSGLAGRVRSVLSGDVNRAELGRRGRAVAALALAAVLVPASALHLTTRSVARAAEPVPVPPASQPSIAAAVQPTGPAPVAASGFGITVDSAVDCGSAITAQVVAADHVAVTLDRPFQLDWWMFRLRGVAGRTLTIDVNLPTRSGFSDSRHSATLTPVYGTVADLNDPAGYTTGPVAVPFARNKQGELIPDTRGQVWHYIADSAWTPERGFTLTQAFTTDTVYIANRVPRPPGYNDRFIDGLAGNPLAKVINIGKTPQGRRLRAVQIGDDAGTGTGAKPCVLMAAGERAYTPDGMWSCQGCVEFLLGDSPEAKALRDQLVFLVIPDLDPDGTAHSDLGFSGSFDERFAYATPVAYANWLQDRVVAGRRLDVVLELHSEQSDEAQHAKLWQLGNRRLDDVPFTLTVDNAVRQQFATAGLTVSKPIYPNNFADVDRFGAWTCKHLGALYLAYMINAQAPSKHLSLSQLKDTGRLLAQAVARVLGSDAGARLMALVDGRQAEHNAALRDRPATGPARNAIESERALTIAMYLKQADHRNPNAATRPVDFQLRPRQQPTQRIATDAAESMYTRASARAELVGQRLLLYARDHDGHLPASLGALAADLDGDDLRDLALDCLTPGDEERAGGVPAQPTGDWIDQHTSYVFPAAGLDLTRLQGQRAAKALAATALFHTRVDQPFFRPGYDDEEMFVITLDGQRQVMPVADAAKLIDKSKATLRAAGVNAP